MSCGEFPSTLQRWLTRELSYDGVNIRQMTTIITDRRPCSSDNGHSAGVSADDFYFML